MILRQDSSFYIEHHSRRKGVYNSRIMVDDEGKRDMKLSAVYAAELVADKNSGGGLKSNHPLLTKYMTVALIDYITSQEQYVRWFGGTSLLVRFSPTRKASRAWSGCIEFSERYEMPLFDIYHELAHHVSLRSDEPSHGQRFVGAFVLIASLSLFQNHATELTRQLKAKDVRFPYGKFFSETFNNQYI